MSSYDDWEDVQAPAAVESDAAAAQALLNAIDAAGGLVADDALDVTLPRSATDGLIDLTSDEVAAAAGAPPTAAGQKRRRARPYRPVELDYTTLRAHYVCLLASHRWRSRQCDDEQLQATLLQLLPEELKPRLRSLATLDAHKTALTRMLTWFRFRFTVVVHDDHMRAPHAREEAWAAAVGADDGGNDVVDHDTASDFITYARMCTSMHAHLPARGACDARRLRTYVAHHARGHVATPVSPAQQSLLWTSLVRACGYTVALTQVYDVPGLSVLARLRAIAAAASRSRSDAPAVRRKRSRMTISRNIDDSGLGAAAAAAAATGASPSSRATASVRTSVASNVSHISMDVRAAGSSVPAALWSEIMIPPSPARGGAAASSSSSSLASQHSTCLCVDSVNGDVDAPAAVENGRHRSQPLQMVCACGYTPSHAHTGTCVCVRDVTRRYSQRWAEACVRRAHASVDAASVGADDAKAGAIAAVAALRAGPKAQATAQGPSWWSEVLVRVNARFCARASAAAPSLHVDVKPIRQPFPTSAAGFKTHPMYVLESQLGSNDVIRPGAAPLGWFKGARIFAREAICACASVEAWLRSHARVVREEELPRPVRVHTRVRVVDGASRNVDTPLYSEAQTQPFVPPAHPEGAPLPSNEHGNYELSHGDERFLPVGLAYVAHSRAMTAAAAIHVEAVPVVTHFEKRAGRFMPVKLGAIVREADAPALRIAVEEAEAAARARADAKRYTKVLARWEKLTRALCIRARLAAEQTRPAARAAVVAGGLNAAVVASDAVDETSVAAEGTVSRVMERLRMRQAAAAAAAEQKSRDAALLTDNAIVVSDDDE